ncbi:uncharacterized protein LOC112572434 [Pomacea canaliculata]|uniref:uncharacterized protein LOC112572434 n=1 Tax=Pomacea canaliculata TaxID=400727 RepID=UPI000D73CD8A|nr:uncharacterized protein LOC112572434 [Pomacea canaliculata]
MMACSPPSSARNLRLLCVLVAGISSALLAGCTPVIAESSECLHGVQDAGGKCTCDPCWSGEHCDQYAKRKPIFFQKTAEVYLSPEHEDGDLVYSAEAIDMDETYACQTKQNCPCAQIHYSIISGNDDLDFHIDSDTGMITTTGESLPFQNKEYILEISADNPGSDEYDVLKLTVHVPVSWDDNIASRYLVEPMGDGYMEPPLLHSIHKRAVYTPPGNVTFVLLKTGVSENITEMRVGTRISFKLQIIFPQNSTDMLVELFAPDNETMVMMLCNVVVQPAGASLSFTGTGTPVLDSANGSTTLFDRAVIDFGNVTFKSTPTSEADVSISITWDAVMIDNVQTQNSTVYWVSAGAEYNYENEVWVGQASFTAITTAEPVSNFGVPTFNLSGPDTMEIGSSAVFTLTMYLPLPSVYLNVDVFAPLNASDVMTVCGMKVRDTGSNYLCGFLPPEHNATLYADSNTRGYGRARLQLGTLTNKGAREAGNPTENNRITIEFVVRCTRTCPTWVSPYWVGAAVEVGKSQIWAGEIAVRALARDTTRVISPSWNVNKTDSGGMSTVKPVVVNIDIKIPRYSIGGYALEALTPVVNSEAVLQLCSVTVASFGTTCPAHQRAPWLPTSAAAACRCTWTAATSTSASSATWGPGAGSPPTPPSTRIPSACACS